MGICGQKGNPSLVKTPQEEKSNELKSPLKARNKIEANYCQLPNEIKHLKYNKLQDKDQHLLHAGLKNLGNTCFINSALQCLLNVQPLSDYFLSEAHLAELNRQNPMGSKGRITEVLAQIVNQISYEETKFVVPENFLSVIREFSTVFGNGSQQDSQEFLIFLLDYLHEDLNRVKIKPYIADKDYSSNGSDKFEDFARESWQNYLLRNKSIVVDLFQGQLKSTLRCLECNTFSHKFETFMYLSVPVPNSVSSSSKVKIEECIAEFTREELLDQSEQWHCTKCSKKTKSTKKIDLWKTPNILIVHLKRFQYTRDSLGKKVTTLIDFKLREFNLSKNVAGKEKCQPIYDLFAVCNHEGSLGGGHYTACAKKWENDEWFNFDDSRVTLINNVQKQLVSSKAYVLFYCKTSVDKFQRQTLSHPENWPHFGSPKKETRNTVKQGDHSLNTGGQPISRGSTFSTLSIIKQPIIKARTFHVSTNDPNKTSNIVGENDKNNIKVKQILEQQELQKHKGTEINTGLFEESLDYIPNNSENTQGKQIEQKSNIQKRKRGFTEHKADEIIMLPPIREKSSGIEISRAISNDKDTANEQLPAGLLTGIKSKRKPRKQYNHMNEQSEEIEKHLIIEKDRISSHSSEQSRKDKENDSLDHKAVQINNSENKIEKTNEIDGNNNKDADLNNVRQQIKDQSQKKGNIQQNEQKGDQKNNLFQSLENNQQGQEQEQHTKDNSIILSEHRASQRTVNSRFSRSTIQEGSNLSNKNQEIIPKQDGKLKGSDSKDSEGYSDYLNGKIQEQDTQLRRNSIKIKNQEINQQNIECSPQDIQSSQKNSYALKARRNNINQNINHWEQGLQDRGHSNNFLPILQENTRHTTLKTEEDCSNSGSKIGPSITSACSNYAKLRRSSQSGRDQYYDLKPINGKGELFEEIRKRSISRQNLPSNGMEQMNIKNRGSSSTKEGSSYYGMSSVSSNPFDNQPMMGQHFQLKNKDNIGNFKLSSNEMNAMLLARQNRIMNFQGQEHPWQQIGQQLPNQEIQGIQQLNGGHGNNTNNNKMADFIYSNFQTSTQGKYSSSTNYSSDINNTPSVLNYQRLNSYQERTGSPSHSTTAGTYESSPRRMKKSNQTQVQGRGQVKLFQKANRLNNIGNNDNKEDQGEHQVDFPRQPYSYPPNGLF